MVRLPVLLCLFCCLWGGTAAAQPPQNDSLHDLLQQQKGKTGYTADTTRFKLLMDIGNSWQSIAFDTADHYHVQALDIARALNDEIRQAEALNSRGWNAYATGDFKTALGRYTQALHITNRYLHDTDSKTKKAALQLRAAVLGNMGNYYVNEGDYTKAISCFERALAINTQMGNKKGMAAKLANMGNLYSDMGDYPKSLSCYFKSLQLANQTHHTALRAVNLSNIGTVYMMMKEDDKALGYFFKAQEAGKKTGNKMAESANYTNIGIIYHNKKDFDNAVKYYNMSMQVDISIGNRRSEGNNLLNLGSVYQDLGQYDKALEQYDKARHIFEETSSMRGLAVSYNNMGQTYLLQHRMADAEKNMLKAHQLSVELESLDLLKDSHRNLSALYEEKNNTAKAFYHYKQYIVYRDSIFNEENTRANLQKEMQYNYDKKAAADSVRFAREKEVSRLRLDKQAAELRASTLQQYFLYGGLVLVIVFSLFLLNRFNVTRRQKHIIEQKEKETREQKHIIEEKHKEITDSINYAERIQRSFLASQQLLSENLPQHFVLFQPKDVVSGDFYWGKKHETGSFCLAVADSTGHGVPGAIMSILNITCLEKAAEITSEPAPLLDHARHSIIQRLKKDGSSDGGRDGMDCVLLCFDVHKKRLKFALANNPLWIIRRGSLIEFDPDKMPVGKHELQGQPFRQHETLLEPGDCLYTFTDGYTDQFGGPKGKKFKHHALKQLLLQIHSLPMEQQHHTLLSTFNDWKGALEQIDDVCIAGIRV